MVIQDGKGDQAEQTNQIQNFITQKYDVHPEPGAGFFRTEITDMCKMPGSRLYSSTVSRM